MHGALRARCAERGTLLCHPQVVRKRLNQPLTLAEKVREAWQDNEDV